MRKDWKNFNFVSYLHHLGFCYFIFLKNFFLWAVLASGVSQTEPHGMLCAPVETSHGSWWVQKAGGARDPVPISPCPA